MKIRIKLVVALCLGLAFIATNCYAQGWATVDTRLLIILHPQMGNFDYSTGRFFRASFSPERNKELYKALNKAEKETRKQLKSLQQTESRLIKRRIELLIERDNTINDLAKKAASSTYQVKGKYKKVNTFEKRFDKQLTDIDNQLEQTNAKMELTTDQAYSPVYLTKIETTNKLLEIKRDIKRLTTEVAAQQRISVVMDNSFGLRPAKPVDKATSIFLQQEDFDLLSSSLFHNLTNFQIDLPPNAAAMKITSEHVAFGKAYSKIDVLKKIAQLRSLLIPFASEYTPGSIFLVGGNDITAHVAKKIFERYKVPESLKKSYVSLISEFGNIENSSYKESFPRYPNEVFEGGSK